MGEKDIFLEPGTEMFWAGTWDLGGSLGKRAADV